MKLLIRHWLFIPVCTIVIGSTVFGTAHGAQAGVLMAGTALLTLAMCWLYWEMS